MKRLEVRGAVRPLKRSLGFKGLSARSLSHTHTHTHTSINLLYIFQSTQLYNRSID